MDAYEEVLNFISRWRRLGVLQGTTGGLAVGSLPKIGTHAYLHVLGVPLGADHVGRLANLIGTPIPLDFENFLNRANGARFFNRLLSLGGYRTTTRTANADELLWEPWDIVSGNLLDTVARQTNSIYFSNDTDGNPIYIAQNGEVNCRLSNGDLVASWPSFAKFIVDELTRLERFHDENGSRLIDYSKMTR